MLLQNLKEKKKKKKKQKGRRGGQRDGLEYRYFLRILSVKYMKPVLFTE